MTQQIKALLAGAADIDQRISKLTAKRREAIELRAAGLSCKEGAEHMGIGNAGFKDLCMFACKTLEVSTVAEAVSLLAQADMLRYRAALMQARDAMRRREPRHQVLLVVERVLN